MRLKMTRAAMATVLLLAAGTAGPATAQIALPSDVGFDQLPRIGAGYVINAPKMFLGLSGHVILPQLGGIGLYVDAKFPGGSLSRESDFVDDMTPAQVEEEVPDQYFFRAEDEWRSFNAALIRPVTHELLVYLGAGYADRDRYLQYADPQFTVAQTGSVWVLDEAESGGAVNVLGGVIFRLGANVAAQFGVESAPAGGTVGLIYSLPLR